MGLDSRAVTPELTRVVVHLAAEVRSFERAEVVTENVLGHKVPRSTIRRLAKQVGSELADLEQHPCAEAEASGRVEPVLADSPQLLPRRR